MTTEDDAILVRRSLDGDRDAFGELVLRYQDLMFNVALRMTNDHEDARDATQSAFIKAWSRLDTFDRRNKFFSWLYRILVNETLNRMRSRRVHVPLDADMMSDERSPAERAESAEAARLVEAGLVELRADHREVIVLRHFLGMSHVEIGGLLDLPEKTVKSRLYTARQALAQVLRRRGVVSA